jgi:hypothetical protein
MQVHREILSRCVEQIKTLAPILICSMKIFIQIISQVRYFIPSSVVDPCLLPLDPKPASFVLDLKDANKKLNSVFLLITF